MSKYDLTLLKDAASTRWQALIAKIAGVDPFILDGEHHACPKACSPDMGGKDRFNMARDGSGGVHCNRCQPGTGDGFGTIQWLTGLDFAAAVEAVAKEIGMKPSDPKKRRKADPAENLEFIEWLDITAMFWCKKKPPITIEAIRAIGGKLAHYRNQYLVVAIPVWGAQLCTNPPVGWVIYQTNGNMLPTWTAGSKTPEWRKVKITSGSEPGIIAKISDLEAKKFSGRVWKMEGPTDLLTLLSIAPNESAFTTASGAKEEPLDWIVNLCTGHEVFVVHDADIPGQQGATWVENRNGSRPGWAPALAQVAKSSANVKLPFEVTENEGPDFRDFVKNGGTFDELLDMSATAEQFKKQELGLAKQILEDEDDPHRLARINLANYESGFNGRLIYYRDEWFKFKDGQYRKIDINELKSKVCAAIRREFELSWHEKARNGKAEPIKKVTRSLVANVVGAMESMCSLPSSVKMPSWLPDRSQRHYLSMKNGILDLEAVFASESEEKYLLKHSPNWFSTFKLDYEFDLSAECPKWQEYLAYSMDNDIERINILQEWAGYLLTTQNDHQRFLVLEGEGGNGKTVYFAAMTAMLGEDNVSHVSIENFDGRFELGTTLGKAANISGDAGEIDMVAEGVLKQFTGGDVMHFDRKNLQPISARPTAKLMAAWNTRPRIRDKSRGLWRRMLLVPFNRKIPESRRIFGMDKPGWWIESGEAPGILLWALVGLHRLMKQKGFSNSEVVDAAMNEYREESNPAIEFFESFQESEDSSIDSGRAYDLYNYWCRKNGCKPLGHTQFGKELKRFFPGVDKVRVRDDGKLNWKLKGIKWAVDSVASQPVNGDAFSLIN